MQAYSSIKNHSLFTVFSHAAVIVALFFHCGCKETAEKKNVLINAGGATVADRIKTPQGFTRMASPPNSFSAYLRGLPLKPEGSLVHYYNNKTKNRAGIYTAVIDLPIGNKDLHQCADAIIHLRAEYLYQNHLWDKISFNLTNGFRADYSMWAQGNRIILVGNKAKWEKTTIPDTSHSGFAAYLEFIYSYCGTLSLSQELKPVAFNELQAGDVLIKGGSPGHAEIVIDVAVNNQGNKIYLLAQSYMPAQDIQILINPSDQTLSPWYEVKESEGTIITPEWTFSTTQLMRFERVTSSFLTPSLHTTYSYTASRSHL